MTSWRAFSLQPYRTETFKLSNDPLFGSKARDIVGLYMNPPDKTLVLGADEKSQMQALDTKTGKVIGKCCRRHRAGEFVKFVRVIDESVPAILDVHLILNNYSTHKTPLVQRWLSRHPRFHVHFTPTYSSWINLIESWFAVLTNRRFRPSSFRSTRPLDRDVKRYIETNSDSPTPFVWSKTADEILDSIKRSCLRTSDSHH